MISWLAVALWIVLGWLAALGARSRGRSPMAWFFLGSLLGWWGLLLLYLLPPVFSEEEAPPAPPPAPLSMEPPNDWFYLDRTEVRGPCTGKDLKEMWKAGRLTSSSWVWNESTVEWKKIGQVQSLLDWLRK